MANEIPDTKATIHQLLKAVGIRRVIYVDDVFSATAPGVLEACNELELSQIRETNLFTESVFEVDDEEVSRSRISEQVGKMLWPSMVRAFATLAALKGDGIDPIDPDAVQTFVSLFGNGVQIVSLNLPRFRRHLQKLLAEVPPSETLFVFDEDFRHDGGTEKEGRRLAADLLKQIDNQPTYLALLTHTVSSERDDEDQRQDEIGDEDHTLKNRLIVIAKRRLAEQEERFAWRFKLALLARSFATLKSHFRDSINSAKADADGKINDLGVQDFERIVFHSSENEGAWPPETLTRLFGIYYGKQLVQSFRRNEAVHRLTESARDLCRITTDAVSTETKRRASHFHRIEQYEERDAVNNLHLPLELGDVFQTVNGESRQFVLLGQPCNLAVRSNGMRCNEPDPDQCVLAVLAEIKSTKKNPKKFVPERWEHFLKWFGEDDSHSWYADLNCTFALPAWLLDLTVFSADGSCRLTPDLVDLPLLIPAWRERRLKLIERIAQRLAKCRLGNNPDSELLQMVLTLPPGGPFRAEQMGGENDWCLSLNLHRIRRIREPFATDIYTHYGHWITRAGFPHELTRLEAKTLE